VDPANYEPATLRAKGGVSGEEASHDIAQSTASRRGLGRGRGGGGGGGMPAVATEGGSGARGGAVGEGVEGGSISCP
jgi:hypothetical protein